MSRVLGFGYMPERTTHAFVVHLPRGKGTDREVAITEEFHWQSDLLHFDERPTGVTDANLKVLLPERLWKEIAEPAKAEFNRRLIRHGLDTGSWTKGQSVPVDRNLGKELVLLCWAVEEADPVLVPNAVQNWLGLSPEERWWLFTMTNAATGQAIGGRNKGWRKAVRFALTENPIAETVIRKRNSDFEMTLFPDEF